MTLILGIETSCDETAAAVVEDGRAVLCNVIASQHELHERYGGVVPEIASRAHIERISPVIDQALQQANATFDDIDAIAVGNRPGLIGSLLVGVSAAKAIAWSTGKPLIAVDHVRAHLYAGALCQSPIPNPQPPVPAYPSLGLVVSGGHTSLYELQSPIEMRLLGRTIDDAVGEAYDKAAVILDIGYPGGPLLDKRAQKGNPKAHQLPRSMLGKESLDFSFSGLKTALLYAVRGKPKGRGAERYFERSADDLTDEEKTDFCASFQAAAIETLIKKLDRAIDAMSPKPKTLLIGGGVSANSLLRTRVVELGEERNVDVFVPAMPYCLDNAAMIAGLAFKHLEKNEFAELDLAAIATTSV